MKRAQFNRKHENTKQWCRRRGLEEQRFYEITKLRRQFEDLLKDCELLIDENDGKLSASERVIRKGELRQLKEMRRAHKYDAPKRRKLKASDTWTIEREDDEEDGKIDIRDVDFRLSHDANKIDVNNLFRRFYILNEKINEMNGFFNFFCFCSTEFSEWCDGMQLSRFNDVKINFGERFISSSRCFR